VHSDDHLADFTRFYESQAQPLIRSVAVATGRPAMAEDAVAEAFARAWLRWPELRRDLRRPSRTCGRRSAA
jgi:DNA-directed RNA polymerase specialized sigma24 family protein